MITKEQQEQYNKDYMRRIPIFFNDDCIIIGYKEEPYMMLSSEVESKLEGFYRGFFFEENKEKLFIKNITKEQLKNKTLLLMFSVIEEYKDEF